MYYDYPIRVLSVSTLLVCKGRFPYAEHLHLFLFVHSPTLMSYQFFHRHSNLRKVHENRQSREPRYYCYEYRHANHYEREQCGQPAQCFFHR